MPLQTSTSLAATLLDRHQPVTILTNDDGDKAAWEAKGASVEIVDVNGSEALSTAFRKGRRAFLLNPQAVTTGDTDVVERATIANIVASLRAQGGKRSWSSPRSGRAPASSLAIRTHFGFESGVEQTGIPTAINRAPFYMTSWDVQHDTVRESGVFETIYPADIRLPIADPIDLGRAGADRLMSDLEDVGIRFIEGPVRYSSTDFAAALGHVLNWEVELKVVLPQRWENHFRSQGFSPEAAYSYTRMSDLAVFADTSIIDNPIVGTITFDEHLAVLVARS